jgi:cardiolipin synthase
MAMDSWKEGSKINIPNLLTFIRIIFVPLLVIFLINGRFFEAFLVFTLAGLTDGLDGLLARWLRQKTRMGAILDPIADKLLLNSSYVVLGVMGLLPDWLAVIVISRDIIIVFGVLILYLFQKGVEIRPTILSKFTTLFQLGTVFIVLLDYELKIFYKLFPLLWSATAVLTVCSGIHYMAIGLGIFQKNEIKKNGQLK